MRPARYLTRGLVFLDMGFRDWAEAELRVFESWKGLPPRAPLGSLAVYDDYGLAAQKRTRGPTRARLLSVRAGAAGSTDTFKLAQLPCSVSRRRDGPTASVSECPRTWSTR